MTPPPKKAWFAYWVVVFGILAFGVPEAMAVLDPNQGDTLSESVRWLADSPLGEIGFIAFLVWFGWHILLQHRNKK